MTSEPRLTDQLAIDRTHLANERTLLAYVRTALALVGAGVAILQFLVFPLARAAGWLLLIFGLLTLPAGVRRFLAVRRHIVERQAGGPGERRA